MTKEEHEKVERFRNAVDRFLTSASNPGRAAAVVHDNTPGSPYHDLVLAKIDVDAMLWTLPVRVLVDPTCRLTPCTSLAGRSLSRTSR